MQLRHVVLDDRLRVHVARAQPERVHDAQLRAVDDVRHASARARGGDGSALANLVVVAVRVAQVRVGDDEAADRAGERRFQTGPVAECGTERKAVKLSSRCASFFWNTISKIVHKTSDV